MHRPITDARFPVPPGTWCWAGLRQSCRRIRVLLPSRPWFGLERFYACCYVEPTGTVVSPLLAHPLPFEAVTAVDRSIAPWFERNLGRSTTTRAHNVKHGAPGRCSRSSTARRSTGGTSNWIVRIPLLKEELLFSSCENEFRSTILADYGLVLEWHVPPHLINWEAHLETSNCSGNLSTLCV